MPNLKSLLKKLYISFHSLWQTLTPKIVLHIHHTRVRTPTTSLISSPEIHNAYLPLIKSKICLVNKSVSYLPQQKFSSPRGELNFIHSHKSMFFTISYFTKNYHLLVKSTPLTWITKLVGSLCYFLNRRRLKPGGGFLDAFI